MFLFMFSKGPRSTVVGRMDWLGARMKGGSQLEVIVIAQARDGRGLDLGGARGTEAKLTE